MFAKYATTGLVTELNTEKSSSKTETAVTVVLLKTARNFSKVRAARAARLFFSHSTNQILNLIGQTICSCRRRYESSLIC